MAAGHEGSGLTLGPATATLLVEHLRQQQLGPPGGGGGAVEKGSLQDLEHWKDFSPDVRLLVASL